MTNDDVQGTVIIVVLPRDDLDDHVDCSPSNDANGFVIADAIRVQPVT